MTYTTEQLEKMLADATPGPWRVRINKRDSKDECDLSICGDIFVLADLNGPQYEHQHPNAALIAAAPTITAELIAARRKLEAVQGLVDALGEIGHMGFDMPATLDLTDDDWRRRRTSLMQQSARAALGAWEATP